MSQTPFSELITAHFAAPDRHSMKRVIDAFLTTQLGIVAQFLDGPSSAARTNVDLAKLADGRTMVLAFADPDAWTDRKLTSTTGRVALDIAQAIPGCQGVAVNCATKAVTLVVTPELVAMCAEPGGT